MDKVIRLYKLVDGIGIPFPNENDQMVTSDFIYNAQRMGAAPSITCSIKYKDVISIWDESVYAQFNGEKFYLHRTPSSTYDNTDVRYKYDLELVSERAILDNVYFFDVVADPSYKGASNTTTFMFSGDVHEFVKRMNYSLQYSGIDYTMVVDDDVTSEDKNMSFSNQTMSSVLQEVYNTYNLPYYFKNKVIHIGTHDHDSALTNKFKYGSDEGLLSISQQNANHKIVNRITGVGSSDNIPYYYPNETPLGEVDVKANENCHYLRDTDFEIDNPNRFSNVGLDNPIVFKKLEPNQFIDPTTGSPANTLDRVYYVDEYRDEPVETLVNYYFERYAIRPAKSEVPSNVWNDFRLLSYDYHVSIRFSTTKDEGGIVQWGWKTHPRYYSIIEEAKIVGSFEHKLFDNLEAYEIGADGKETKIDVHYEGDDLSGVVKTTYLGVPNANGGRDVEIHLKFTFWKHGEKVTVNNIETMNFTQISLQVPDIGNNPYYWESERYQSADIKDFGIKLSEYALGILEDAPDSILGEGCYLMSISRLNPQPNLMPPVFRNSGGTERFYDALNDTYIQSSDDDGDIYYSFEHPYIEGHPQEHIQNFDDIKPTIVGMLNDAGQPYNQFIDIAYDEGDNDEIDEQTEQPLHPYFYVKLPKYNGVGAFNLFDHASEAGAMTISMTNGYCSACNFEIAVDEEKQTNIIQVDENGDLVRDQWGRVATGTAQTQQNDTINNEVWLALKKDVSTFPSTMPNDGVKNKVSVDDTFVITNILLPHSFILDAEKRLEDALIEFMSKNNSEKFTFSIKFSRIYLEEHPEVLATLTENSSIIVVYHNIEYALYVSSYTYKMSSNAILPDITVQLADTITIQQNAVANAISAAKTDILNSISSTNFVRQGVPFFLRKDVNDEAQGRITFNQGLSSNADANFGKFVENTRGAGIFQDGSGNWHIESDYVRVRKKLSAKSVEIEEAHHIGGHQMLTAASAKIDYVYETDTYYRCFFLKEDTSGNTIYNQWKVGDQAYCKRFNLIGHNEDGTQQAIDRFFWRAVVGTSLSQEEEQLSFLVDGETMFAANYHFIDVSKDVSAEGSDAPLAGDNIVQLGYRGTDDPSRQNAIILAGSGEGSPYIQQFVGINSFTLPDPETQIKPNDNILTGRVVFQQGSSGLENLSEWSKKQQQIDNAINTASEAKTVASQANAAAEAASQEAQSAQSAAEDAQTKADAAKTEAEDAAAEASQANAAAEAAKEQLDSWVADGVISPLEVQALNNELAQVNAEAKDILADIARYSIDNTAYHTAKTYYATELTTIIGNNGTTDTTQLRARQTTYYSARTTVLEAISVAAKKVATDAQDAADIAQETADTATEKATAAHELALTLQGTTETLEKDVDALNQRLDGVVENHFLEGAPTLTTAPVTDWTTDKAKINHVGDTYTNVNEYYNDDGTVKDEDAGKSWRWCYCAENVTPNIEVDDNGTKRYMHWHPIADSDAVKALLQASQAQSTADGKRRIFVDTPFPPYDKGDLWAGGENEPLKVCTQAKSSGAFNEEEWGLADNTEAVAKAAEEEAKNHTDRAIAGLETGTQNLVRNSGFTGDFETAKLDDGDILGDASALFSPPLTHWDATNATVQESSNSQSGNEVVVTAGGSIIQTLVVRVQLGAKYTMTFYGTGGGVQITLGGVTQSITMNSTWAKYSVTFETTTSNNTLQFVVVSTTSVVLSDIMLIKGTIVPSWTPSPLDNRTTLAKYEEMTYLQQALKVTTIVDGGELKTGLINAAIMSMGNVTEDGVLSETTAGVSGIYNSDDSVAFFGGGDLEKAISTVNYYAKNPSRQPTPEELATMANFVVTHGGRAILQDIILRGYVYAEAGVFNGTVKATDGVFNGTVVSKLVYGPTKVIEEDEYTIDPSVEAFGYYVYYPRPVGSVDPVVILPSAQQYEGMEIAFYLLQPQTRAGGHWVTAKTTNEEQVVYTPNTYPLRIDEMLAYQFVHTSGQTVWGDTVVMCKDGEYRFKAIQGTWYAIAGLYIET